MSSSSNPLQHAAESTRKAAPWAALTRLGGDRVALLFEDLRQALGRIEGLIEELQYDENSRRWRPHYSVAGQTVLTLTIAPGMLGAEIELDPQVRSGLLESARTAASIKAAIAGGLQAGGNSLVRLRISSRRDVQALASLVRLKSGT